LIQVVELIALTSVLAEPKKALKRSDPEITV